MAHHVEPMDVDSMDSDFDNKENTFHLSNVLPCTEKGYEELDVSELNMKLRYSMTPASSPMSKSYTASLENRNLETGDSQNYNIENGNLTRSLNSTMTKNDSVIKALKSLPLQSLPTEQFIDGSGNASILRQLDSTLTDNINRTVTVSGPNDFDENLSLPSSSSSALHTPEATTPTKEIVKDGGSPIMRGLKSVLNMFRPSQSPIPPNEDDSITVKHEILSPLDVSISENVKPQAVASTPIAAHRSKDGNNSKRSSPYKDSIVFNDDLETELNWKDETTILFSHEKIPIHKLFIQSTKPIPGSKPVETDIDVQKFNTENNFNSTVEHMDVSYNESVVKDRTMTELQPHDNDVSVAVESDCEFVDCETTFSKNESQLLDNKETEEKSVSLKTSETQNIHVTQDISFADNTPAANAPFNLDVTGLSSADGEFKNDKTVPSDYSDYSKETNEILSELEKWEENDISTVEFLDTKISSQENTPQNKEFIEQQAKIHEITTNITFEKDKQEHKTTESQIHEFDTTRKVEEDVSSTEKLLDTNMNLQEKSSEKKDVINQQAEPHEITTNTQEDNKEHEIGTTISDESKFNILEELKPQVENTLSVEQNANITHCDITQPIVLNDPEPVNEMIQNAETYIEPDSLNTNSKILHVILNQENVNVPNVFDVTIDPDLQILNADQKILETTFIQDLNNADSNSIVDTKIPQLSTESPIVIPKALVNIGPTEMLNVTQNEFEVEMQDILQSPADVPLPDDEFLKSSLEIVPSEPLNVTQNIFVPEIAEVLQTESPSDIPLGDDDDFDMDSKIGEVMATLPEGAALALLPEIQNVANVLSECYELSDNDDKTFCNSLSDAVLEDGIQNNSLLPEVLNISLPQTSSILTAVIPEALQAAETELKMDEKPLEVLCKNEVSNEIKLPEQSFEMVPESLEITKDSTSEVTKTIDASLLAGGKMTIDGIFLTTNNTVAFDQTYEDIADDVAQIVDDSKCETKVCDATVVKDNLELAQNNTRNEPADFINENLNQTRVFPDLVNQTTTIVTDDNLQNLTETITTVHIPMGKQEEYVISPRNVDITNSESSLDIIPVDKQVGFDLIKSESALLKTVTAQHTDDCIDHENQGTVTSHTSIVNEKQCDNPDSQSENDEMNNASNNSDVKASHDQHTEAVANSPNVQSMEVEITNVDDEIVISEKQCGNPGSRSENVGINNASNNSDIKASHDQHTEAIANTPNVQSMEVEITNVDDEIVVSENNSPYVSLMAGVDTVPEKIDETFEEIVNPFVTNTNIALSPPISSKGYNFNFDEMDDPFATKTKIRMSPPLDTPTKLAKSEDEKKAQFELPKKEISSRRKSQPPERKKLAATKKKFNTTFDARSDSKTSANKIDAITEDSDVKTETKHEKLKTKQVKEKASTETTETFDSTQTLQNFNDDKKIEDLVTKSEVNNTKSELVTAIDTNEESKCLVDSVSSISNALKITSSSEQSTYYSAGASSTESSHSKNVFNLPEIDDINFNPFVTKSKMRQSPPPNVDIDNPFATKAKLRSSSDTSMISPPQSESNSIVTTNQDQLAEKNYTEDKMETELMEKDTSANTTDKTSSSKATDNQNLTTRELNTEDEDTIEGPFLEDDIDKITDFDDNNVDMMQFNKLPTQEPEDSLEGGELFIDAEAFEFLLNQNKSNVVADSGKESLFLKFDPLFAKRISSDGVLAALSKVQKRQSTPTKLGGPSLRNEASPIAGPSTLNVSFESDNNISQESNEDINITVSKPMMKVTPAVNPAVTPRNKSATPTGMNRRSITFTSPAIAVIDRLLSMSANNSLMGQDTTMVRTNREQTEANLALTQLRELLAEKEISVYNLRSESKELKDRLSTMESQVRILEADGQERLKKINELNERLAEKTKINRSMAAVVEEYERTIASLIAETEQDKKRNAEERIRLINERDEQTAHLASMEVSFSDLHSKYEKSKQVILICKANQDTYKKSIKDFEENLTKMQTNYEMLKQHATSKLNHANQELEKLNRAHEADVVKFNAMIKRKDMHITSLEETLTQKTKANEELTAICDELINKVG